MSKTYSRQREATERWGDARHLRARLKVKARRSERHALADPLDVMEGAAPDLVHRLSPVTWRHDLVPG